MIKNKDKKEFKNDIRSLKTVLFAVILFLYTMSSCSSVQEAPEFTAMQVRIKEQKKRLYTEARIERKAERKYKLLNNYKNGYYRPYYAPYESHSQDIYDMRTTKIYETSNHRIP